MSKTQDSAKMKISRGMLLEFKQSSECVGIRTLHVLGFYYLRI